MNTVTRPIFSVILLGLFFGISNLGYADIPTADIIVVDSIVIGDASTSWTRLNNYKIWEANRQVFLYPDNWTQPEDSSDKTAFFDDVLMKITQNQTTDILEIYKIWMSNDQVYIAPENLLMQSLSNDGQNIHTFNADRFISVSDLGMTLFSNIRSEGFLLMTNSAGIPVPEPGTLMLFGMGLAALIAARKRVA